MEPYCRGRDATSSGFDEEVSCKPFASEASQAGGFDCNICLEAVQDPVVTFCGHLYCWPCIYKWIISFPQNPDEHNPRCPVCKTEVSEKTMIPLYGRGQTTHPSKNNVPNRPSTPVSITRDSSSPFNHRIRTYYRRPEEQQPDRNNHYTASAPSIDPMIGVFGEMVYARIFGDSGRTTLYAYPNSYRYTTSPGQQQRMFQMNRSLGRVCFFLCCCALMCLLLF